jgi:hypothetical protein
MGQNVNTETLSMPAPYILCKILIAKIEITLFSLLYENEEAR